MRRWTLLSRAERGGVIVSGAWTTSTCYKPREIERHRFARGALDARIMRVARQAPTAATGCLAGEWPAQGQDNGEDACDKGRALVTQLQGRGFMLKSDGEGTIVTRLADSASPGASSGQRVVAADDPREEEGGTMARGSRRASGLH